MANIKIVRATPGGPVTVDPPTLKLAKNDFVVFTNLDQEQNHQPTKKGEAADFWFNDPILKFLPSMDGQDLPPDTSAQLQLGSGPDPISYVIDAGSNVGGTITF